MADAGEREEISVAAGIQMKWEERKDPSLI